MESFLPKSRVLRGWTFVLLGMIVLLLVVHVLGQSVFQFNQTPSAFTVDLIDRFNVDKELSVPTWFASFLAVMAAAFAFLNANASPKRRNVWWLLGGVFLLICLDEVAALHELTLQGLHIVAGFGEGQTLTHNAWLFVLPVALVISIIMILWVKQELGMRMFIWLGLGLGIYLLGALVVEYLTIPIDKVAMSYRFGYTTTEEGLELLGMWVLLATSIRYFEYHHAPVLAALKKERA